MVINYTRIDDKYEDNVCVPGFRYLPEDLRICKIIYKEKQIITNYIHI